MARACLVVAINGFFGRGGTERQIVDIATGMRDRGWDVCVLSRWPVNRDSENAQALAAAAVPVATRPWSDVPFANLLNRVRGLVYRNNERRETSAWRWQGRKLRQFRDPVVHEIPYFGQLPPPAAAMHRALRIPHVQTILGSPDQPVPVPTQWTVVTTDGDPLLEPPETPVAWIPCMTSYAPSHRSSPLTKGLRVLFVGRVEPSKGLDLVLDALPAVPHVSLTVVGDGTALAHCKARAEPAGERVKFLGSLPREGVFAELANADTLVVPSRSAGVALREGTPTVVIEALAHAVPVLVTAVGGLPRLFDRIQPGWLVAPDDPASLGAQLAALSAKEIAARSKDAAWLYERELRPDRILDAYEDCYERARFAVRATA